MDYLQYKEENSWGKHSTYSFKPYYKWITFNIETTEVLMVDYPKSFKPYYKWITFNIFAFIFNILFSK